jgi:ABC-2 type transport system ATP-binding protein
MILTSHYMGDIEALCNRVVIINKGKKMYDGLLTDLKNKYAPERKIEIFLGSLEEKKLFASIKAPKRISENIGIIRVQKDKMGDIVTEVFEKFEPENISISDIDTEEVIAKLFQKK